MFETPGMFVKPSKRLIMKVRRGVSKEKPREPVLRKSELRNVHSKKRRKLYVYISEYGHF